jgi:hypothetical protein
MKSVLRAVVAAAVLLTAPAQTLASTIDLESAVWSALKWGNGDQMSPADRLELARAALAYWENFDSRVPRNSPASEKWLHEEMDTTDPARIGHVVRTPEYALYSLVATSSNCADLFTKMIPTIGGDKAVELYFWLKATSCYQDEPALASYLQQAGLSNGRADGDFRMQFFESVMSAINGKLANTIISE